MFQYAAARILAQKNDAELVIDTWSGFIRDYQYRRSYELNAFNISCSLASPIESIPFWIELAEKKITKEVFGDISKHFYGSFIHELENEFSENISNYKMRTSCWMTGYWQSSKYFNGNESLILNELMPPIPIDERFIQLGDKVRDVNSVALGVRLYEESNNPDIHTSDGKLKSINKINTAIYKLIEQQEDLHFFVFCTHRADILKKLEFRGSDVTYVTAEDGFIGTVESLWLMTQCRHHIFTNSTFYWWGAWLSRSNYSVNEQMIFCADNFVNKDTIDPHWSKF